MRKKLIAMAMAVTLGFTGLVPAITVNASGNIEDTGIVSESTVFAATDEFHQRFVPGRYGCLRDVLIDAAGSIIGLMIAYVIYKNMCKHKENKYMQSKEA